MKWLLIGWVVLKECIEILLSFFNIKYSTGKNRKIPAHLESTITEDRYLLSKQYLKDHSYFGILNGALDLLVTILLLLSISPILESLVKIYSKSTIWQGLLFFGSIFFINFIISIPFSLYETFKIEAKYGFNKTTYRTFIMDSIKSLLVSILLGGFLLSGFMVILIRYPFWWWRLSIASSLFLVFAMWLFPVFLLPLFNRFKPLEEGELKDTIVSFTTSHHININKIFVMDASTRSTHGNAFLTGMGFSRRLVLFDTILDYPKEEILSIIAHEWGHHIHHDIYKQLFTSILSFIGILYLSNLLFVSGIIQKSFFVQAPYSLLFYSFALISPVLFYLSSITNFIIRKQEYDADLFSLLTTKDLNPAIKSLKRLISDNLSNLNPHPLYRIFYYTHPAPEERIQFLIKKAGENKI
jgi:STE24 endopeptidase